MNDTPELSHDTFGGATAAATGPSSPPRRIDQAPHPALVRGIELCGTAAALVRGTPAADRTRPGALAAA